MIETNYVVPPGQVLAEWLDEQDMTQTQLAARLRRSVKHVNQIVHGVASLSPELARQLETVTTIPAQFWLRMQVDYQLDRVRLEQAPIDPDDAAWLDRLPCPQLRKLGHVQATRANKPALLQQVLTFFGVSDRLAWDEVFGQPAAQFRRSLTGEGRVETIAAWLRIGELKAAASVAPEPFSKDRLRGSLPAVKALTREPDGSKVFPQLVDTLRSAGVTLLLVPDIPGTKLHGATWWRGSTAVIQQTARHRTDDVFWFTLLHELAHVLLHERGRTFLDGSEMGDPGSTTTAEAEADHFAGTYLIPATEGHMLHEVVSLADVETLARRWGVSAGVVVGRMHHDQLRSYSWGHHLKRKIILRQE